MFTWVDPDFNRNLPLLGLALLIMAYLVLLAPIIGRRQYRNLRHRLMNVPGARSRYYVGLITSQWLLGLGVLEIVVLSPGVTAEDVGLVAPREVSLLGSLTAFLALAYLISGWRVRRAMLRGTPLNRGFLEPLLPRTPAQRWLAVLVAASAGICEELVYRGLFIAIGVGVFGLSPVLAAVVSLVFFVAAHLYQGVRGMIGVAVIGLVLTLLYGLSQSLLLPMVIHITIDVVAFVVIPLSTTKKEQPEPEAAVPTQPGSELIRSVTPAEE